MGRAQRVKEARPATGAIVGEIDRASGGRLRLRVARDACALARSVTRPNNMYCIERSVNISITTNDFVMLLLATISLHMVTFRLMVTTDGC